jgi:hypothetical protein
MLRALGNPLASLKWVSKNYFVFLNPYVHFFQIAFNRDQSYLGLERPEVEKKVPKNYTSSLAIKTTCTTLKWVSKYDFIFANEEFYFSKITFNRG